MNLTEIQLDALAWPVRWLLRISNTERRHGFFTFIGVGWLLVNKKNITLAAFLLI